MSNRLLSQGVLNASSLNASSLNSSPPMHDKLLSKSSRNRALLECSIPFIYNQGLGGGGLGTFCPGQKIFFGQNQRKIIFFAGPSCRIVFFNNRKLHL